MALMATSHPPFLEVTQPDDDMEISSDAGRLEHDDDIDLVDGDDDIDYMLEDSRSEQGQPRIDELPDATRDDIMYDDLDEITYAEDTMHDDLLVPDEHLTDVSELHEETGYDQFSQPQVDDVGTTSTQDNVVKTFDASNIQQVPDSETLIDTVDYYEADPQQNDFDNAATTRDVEISATEPTTTIPEPDTRVQEQRQEHANAVKNQSNEHPQESLPADLSYEGVGRSADGGIDVQPPSESAQDFSIDHTIDTFEQPSTSPQNSGSQDPSILSGNDTFPSPKSPAQPNHVEAQASSPQVDNNKSPQPEEALTSEDEPRSIHSVIVDYEGAHISLFPPMQGDEADTFLLKDSSLAEKTLVDLFRACRQVLGESIGEDIELEIYSEDLDLTISEDSVHCMTTSFSQLIDVYVTLSQQDGNEHPEPFFISLTKKSRFSSRLTALYLAASESKGLSEVHAEPYSEEFLEPVEDEQDNDEHDRLEEETVAGQPNTEVEPVKDQDREEESTEEEQTGAPKTTDQETIDDEVDETYEEEPDVNEPSQEEDDTLREFGGTDQYAQEQFDEEQIPEDEHEQGNKSKMQAEANTGTETLGEDKSLDQTGGAENGDDESSGSSTVQGENDPLQSCQYSSSDDSDDDSWLIDDEDTANGHSPEYLPTISELAEDKLSQSNFDADVQHPEVAAPEPAEWQQPADHTENPKSNSEEQHPEDEEDYILNPEAVAEDWDQLGHEDEEHNRDESHEEAPQHEGNSEHVAENEWGTFDEELDFDIGAEQPDSQTVVAPETDVPTSSGTFRVPDDSAEDDEDSITYDDDQLDLSPQPETDTAQARSISQSPLGKRSRGDDEDGGEDSSDQESKRLRSH